VIILFTGKIYPIEKLLFILKDMVEDENQEEKISIFSKIKQIPKKIKEKIKLPSKKKKDILLKKLHHHQIIVKAVKSLLKLI